MLGHAIHNHDLIATLMGPIERVAAFVDTRVNPIETEDCAAISMQTRDGALVTSSITLGAASDTTRFHLCFENLTATSGTSPYAPMAGDWSFQARDAGQQDAVDQVVAGIGEVQSGFTGFLSAVGRDLSSQPASVVTAEDGRQSISLVAAIYHAARYGEVVTLPLSEDHPLYQGWHPATDN